MKHSLSKDGTATRFLIPIPRPTIGAMIRVVILPGISLRIWTCTFTVIPPRLFTQRLVLEVRVEHFAALCAPFARWAGVAHI